MADIVLRPEVEQADVEALRDAYRKMQELSPADNGTRMRITENGEVPNVLFRFMSGFVFGHTGTMDTYLKALGRKFGEEVTPK